MEVINKIVISTNPPRENYVLWANPNTHLLYYWNNGWQTFFYDKKDEKQNKYDLKLLTNRKEITGAINELFTMIGNLEITIDLEPIAKEDSLLRESAAIKEAIADKPEVDLSGVAKEATSASILSAINSISASMYKGVPITTHTGSATISPNVWNVWNTVNSITITKGVGIEGIVNTYFIRFVAGNNCNITFQGFSLNWYGGSVPKWNSGSTYEISIIDNLALWVEF